MAPHSRTLAWEVPWTEEPGRLLSMGSLRVRQDLATSLSLSTFMIGEGNGNPLQCSCLENSRDGGAWWAAVYGVAQSRTRLKRLSSSRKSQGTPALPGLVLACLSPLPHTHAPLVGVPTSTPCSCFALGPVVISPL